MSGKIATLTLRAILLVLFTTIMLSDYQARAQIDVYLDAGHGGSDPGNVIPDIAGCDEKDINLEVCLEIVGWFQDFSTITYELSRITDTFIDLKDRAYFANSLDAELFVSVHHNSTSNPATQHTVCLYSTFPYCEGEDNPDYQAPRNIFDTAAVKIGSKIDQLFGYGLASDHRRDVYDAVTVLSRSKMLSCVTEASFTSNPEEAYRLCNNADYHRSNEAYAIFWGIESTLTGQGFGRVDYAYYALNPFQQHDVRIWEYYIGSRIYSAPFVGVWNLYEPIGLEALDFTQDGYTYTFDHWEHKNWYDQTTISSVYNPVWEFEVDYAFDSEHWYVAYFRGGPFESTFEHPAPSVTEIQGNRTYTIRWSAPAGVQSSCSVYVDFSSNGGANWSTLVGPVPYNYGESKDRYGIYEWQAPDINAPQCQLRIRARDYVDNYDETISHQFAVGCFRPHATVEAEPTSGNYPLTVQFYGSAIHEVSSWEWDFGDGAVSSEQNPLHIYTEQGV